MEKEAFDLYLARALKKELLLNTPPVCGKSQLLAQAALPAGMKSMAWFAFPLKRTQNAYRVHVCRGIGWFDRMDNLVDVGSIEFRLLNYQHLVA